jgi:hypothetical protein
VGRKDNGQAKFKFKFMFKLTWRVSESESVYVRSTLEARNSKRRKSHHLAPCIYPVHHHSIAWEAN